MSSKLNELMITRSVTASSIISIEISIRMMFLRFRTKPRIPIRKSTRDRFMVYRYSLRNVPAQADAVVLYTVSILCSVYTDPYRG